MSINVAGVTAVTIQFNGTEPVLVENTGGWRDGVMDWPRRLVFDVRSTVAPDKIPIQGRIELSAYGTYALRRFAEQILEVCDEKQR
jgi:hypothetical protein